MQRLSRSDHPGLEPVTPEVLIMGEVWMCAHKWGELCVLERLETCVSWKGLNRERSNGRVRWGAQ